MRAKYNGFQNWTHWTVSLWIKNNDSLNDTARQCIEANSTRADAVEEFIKIMKESGVTETPDKAKYSKSSVRAAMVGM